MKFKSLFCLALSAVLMCGVFTANSFAAGADPDSYGVLLDSCSTHTAAVCDGDLYVWGTNEAGQFPKSKLSYSVEPVKVLTGVADVAVSENRTLVLMENGSLYSYGLNLADGTTHQIKQVASGVAQMSSSDTFSLLVTTKGALYAWGNNEDGLLGVGDAEEHPAPVCVVNGGVKKAVAGNNFALALCEDGSLIGWGANASSQIGYEVDGAVPEWVDTPVTILQGGVKDIDAGNGFSCILKTDGSVWTCGHNELSQLGIDSMENSAGLTKILDNIRSISAGSNHGFAISTDGQLYHWGFGLSGQLGNGSRERSFAATAADDLGNYVQVFATDDATFALDKTGALYAWGSNSNMLLGQQFGKDATEPVQILTSDLEWAFDDEDISAVTPEGKPVTGSGSAADDETEEDQDSAFVSGYPDGTFRPKAETTRAEFLTMLVTALGDYDKETVYGTATFTDIDQSRWYANYVAYAQKTGLVSGYKDNTFHPNDKITRAEAAAMTAAAMGLTGTATESSFTDVSGWAVKHIEVLATRKILSGDGNGTFRPNDNIIRSEAVTIVANATGFNAKSEATVEAVKTAENPFSDVPAESWAYPYVLRAAGVVE